MLKLTAIVSLLLIGSTMWAASLSCDSCGSECASACGTRQFRSCCFNYLRKKRVSDGVFKFHTSLPQDFKIDAENFLKSEKAKMPLFFLDSLPDQWMTNIVPNEYRNNPNEDVENRFFNV